MKHKKRSFEFKLNKKEVNELAALAVIMKTIDIIRNEGISEGKDERSETKGHAC